MNGGTVSWPADANGNVFSVVNGAAVTYNGTTTNNSGATTFTRHLLQFGFRPDSAVPRQFPAAPGCSPAKRWHPERLSCRLDVPYTATVLQQRQLAAAAGSATIRHPARQRRRRISLGAWCPVPTGYSVMSTLRIRTTPRCVYVSGSSRFWRVTVRRHDSYGPPMLANRTVGQVYVSQRRWSIAPGPPPFPVSSRASALGRSAVFGHLSVATAEAASVHDNTNYAPVGLAYNVSNVGYAATGGSPDRTTSNCRPSAPALGDVLEGSTLATFYPCAIQQRLLIPA